MNAQRIAPSRALHVWSLLLGLSAGAVYAANTANQPRGGPYSIERFTLDSGGGNSSGGTYQQTGSIAQLDADPLQPASGGNYELVGGFWAGLQPSTPLLDAIFGDGFE